MKRVHGGPNESGRAKWDFSTNNNACGPCPIIQTQLAQLDASSYPDYHYTQLQLQLAQFHQVSPERIVLATSASEMIMRISSYVAFFHTSNTSKKVWYGAQSYGDYPYAAKVWQLEPCTAPSLANLIWLCEPSSPLGQAQINAENLFQFSHHPNTMVVLDRAYEPLRLSGVSSFSNDQCNQLWQLWSPNKVLGLTGVRAAYLIAPEINDAVLATIKQLNQLAASWPIGSHGVAMLEGWTQPKVQEWIQASLLQLQILKAQQIQLLSDLDGVEILSSQTNFFCIKAHLDAQVLKQHQVQLRDANSFGLPGVWRISVKSSEAQQALIKALKHALVK
jgi:histidinol-phosphate aminotransferase